MRPNPKTEQQAIEKLYRIRMYLIRSTREMTLAQIIAANHAERIIARIQRDY